MLECVHGCQLVDIFCDMEYLHKLHCCHYNNQVPRKQKKKTNPVSKQPSPRRIPPLPSLYVAEVIKRRLVFHRLPNRLNPLQALRRQRPRLQPVKRLLELLQIPAPDDDRISVLRAQRRAVLDPAIRQVRSTAPGLLGRLFPLCERIEVRRLVVHASVQSTDALLAEAACTVEDLLSRFRQKPTGQW